MIRPLYDVTTGDFKRLEETIGLICIKGDPEEVFCKVFFRYGCNDRKSKVLYSVQKKRIPNPFSDILFSKHKTELLNEPRQNSSKLF